MAPVVFRMNFRALSVGAWPFPLSIFNFPLLPKALWLSIRQAVFQGHSLSFPSTKDTLWVFSQVVSFSWRILPYLFARPPSTHPAKPSSDVLSSWKPRLEKMPFFYISTASMFTRNKCLSTLWQLLVLLVPSIYLGVSWIPNAQITAGPRTAYSCCTEHRRNRSERSYLSSPKQFSKCNQLRPHLWVVGAQKEGMCLCLFFCRTKGHIQDHRCCKKQEQHLVIATGKVQMLSCGFFL